MDRYPCHYFFVPDQHADNDGCLVVGPKVDVAVGPAAGFHIGQVDFQRHCCIQVIFPIVKFYIERLGLLALPL